MKFRLVLWLVAIVALGGCSRSRGGEKGTVAENGEALRKAVSVETVRTETFVVYGEYLGEARGIAEVKLKADVDGRVESVFAKEGGRVSAGQSLAEIDSQKADKTYQAAVLSERLARETYEREQRFLAEGSSFQLKVDEAHLDWLQSQSNLLKAKSERDSAFAITPISGVVLIRYIDLYDNIESGDPTFEIADLSRIRLTVDVPEADIAGVRELNEAEVVFSSYPGRLFAGVPTSFARGRSENSLSYQVTVLVENPDMEILSGQTARVRLVLRRFPDSISIPSRAVLIRTGGHYVFVVRDGIAHEVQVRTGASSNTRTLIEEGLFTDDVVVTEGLNRLTDGELVEVRQ
ncbi:MAG: hypothetical protein B0D92_01020 [Spirochaeta sp. LUC14_002_19_P3]|nr:MAG: hypothetical protein B0D92_01020 [Spirochaeta sp. LUC14_002_19_P3]